MPELRRFFFWCCARWFAADDPGSGWGSSPCAGGVDGGSAGSEGGAGDAGVDACETLEARRVASDEAEELVASRMYSTTSHVCSVASGAKETRRLASDLRRASRRFFSSSSFEARIDLTAGMKADYRVSNTTVCSNAGAYLSAVPGALLQRLHRRRLELSQTAGADALATRLARRLLGRQCGFLRRLGGRSERAIRHQAIGDVVFAGHGRSAVRWFVVVVFGTRALM
jgi:hypothetical protein